MKIQNAGDLTAPTHHKFMVVGQAGSGKSKLVTTLPGRTFAWVFDPAAESAYRGCPWVDYKKYTPDRPEITPRNRAGTTKPELNITSAKGIKPPKVYIDYADDYNQAWTDDFYAPYDNIVMDSYTLFEQAALDAVLYNNDRYGCMPSWEDDYPSVMALVLRNVRGLTSVEKNVVIIFHDYFEKDDQTKKLIFSPIIIGKKTNAPKMPVYFNHYLRCSSEQIRRKSDNQLESRYFIQTTPSRDVPGIRTAFQGLDPMHDVTIGDFSRAQEFGLGRIMKEQK